MEPYIRQENTYIYQRRTFLAFLSASEYRNTGHLFIHIENWRHVPGETTFVLYDKT